MPQTEWENLASLLSLAVALVMGVALWLVRIPVPSATLSLLKLYAGRTSLWFVLIPALSFVLNIGIALHRGIPRPLIHDEFSYVLAGDTFAHGRLTNPTPEYYEHFETPQELVRPTRMSKYPPGQGLFIALGQVLTGMPIVGIWISTAAACGASYWMLLGFVSRPWAMVGGMMAAFSPALLNWSQVYWGGCVAVLGGALLLGGWGRLMARSAAPLPRRALIAGSVTMSIGLAILANSRPYEGTVASIPLLICLILHYRNRAIHIFMAAAPVLLSVGLWMGYYNYRVTGQALRLPFAEYTAQYDVYPKFWFQSLGSVPVYRNRSQRWVHTDFEQGLYYKLRTLRGFSGIACYRVAALFTDNLKLYPVLLPFSVGLVVRRDARLRWVMISVVFMLIALLAENFDMPHYSAPINAMLLLLVVVGLSRLWSWERTPREALTPDTGSINGNAPGQPNISVLNYSHFRKNRVRFSLGQCLVIAVLAGFAAGSGMCIVEGLPRDSQIVDQATLINDYRELQTGRHIIFVKYGPMTELINGFANEYVFNAADLDSSRIIWARWFGSQSDRAVAHEYPDRNIWLLDVGSGLKLNHYLEQEPVTGGSTGLEGK